MNATNPITTAAALAMFVRAESVWPWTLEPIAIGAHAFATDRNWLVRTPLGNLTVKSRENLVRYGVPNNMPELIDTAFAQPWPTDALTMAGMALPEPEQCTACNGTGLISWIDCSDCKGNGCKECDGAGGWPAEGSGGEPIDCFLCQGGVTNASEPVRVGETMLAIGYLWKLKTIPGCTLAPGYGEEVASRFRFPLAEGGEALGLLMPMRER